MKLNSLVKGMMLLIPLLLLSCSDEEQALNESKCRIVCSVDEFESTNQSRTNTDPDNNFLITWASGDVIGIFPREGYQEPFEIPANQVGNESASFDGGYWAVKDGLQYNAYYPFDKKNFDSAEMKTMIPVSYIGQTQNGTSCDIGAFDYTYSDWKTATGGKISFSFHHIGAIAVFSLKYPATTTYTQLTLSVDEALIPLKGTYDLTADDVSLNPDNNSLSTTISLELNNCSGIAGETGVFYMMLPPMDLSNNEVTFTLTSSAGTTCVYTIEKALNINKGKLYRRTGIPQESNVEGTIDGWLEEDEIPYVTFTAGETQTLTMSKAVATLEYSVNNGDWAELGTNTITFGGTNGTLRLRGKSSIGTATSSNNYSTIVFGDNTAVECAGDLRTLIDYDNYTTIETNNAKFCSLFAGCASLTTAPELPATTMSNECYSFMFSGCTSLTSAPNLPATSLADYCYDGMFYGCTLLTAVPELPAASLADYCYSVMFWGCTSLTIAPELPATTLANNCYENMFSGCTSLTAAPELPATSLTYKCYYGMFSGCISLAIAPELSATTLAENCYGSIFGGCTSLTAAPELPATILASSCYEYMFSGCESLTTAPVLPATSLADYCYFSMFNSCTSLTTAPELPATTLAYNCYDHMFSGCESLITAPELPATTLAFNCYEYMFEGCTSLTTAPELPATTLTDFCYSGMFSYCESLTTAPELPAAILVENCYSGMFNCCRELISITMLATDISAANCLNYWVDGVSFNVGTFIKNKEMTSLPTGVHGIPEDWIVKDKE